MNRKKLKRRVRRRDVGKTFKEFFIQERTSDWPQESIDELNRYLRKQTDWEIMLRVIRFLDPLSEEL